MDLLAGLVAQGYKPEAQEDGGGFEPISGAYLATIERLERVTGDKGNGAYDFYSLNLKIYETIEGDKGDNRYLKQNYKVEEKGLKKFMYDMFTAGITCLDFNSLDTLDLSLVNAIGKTVQVRAWVRPKQIKDGDKWVDDPSGEKKQWVKIVKQFKLKKKDGAGSTSPTSKVPF